MKSLFSTSELSKIEALEIKGGALAADGIMGQAACVNKAAGCGLGVDQGDCENLVMWCGATQTYCPPKPPRPSNSNCYTHIE